VRLSKTGRTVHRRLDADSYTEFEHARWTPYYGPTNLGHGHKRDLTLGIESGASSGSFTVLRYWAGRLHTIKAPDGVLWSINSDGDSTFGYRCTAGGIETRSVFNGRNFRKWSVLRNHYVRRHGRWERDAHHKTTVRSNSQPPGTGHFGYFECHGLPQDER
jgi:hypothetical protein